MLCQCTEQIPVQESAHHNNVTLLHNHKLNAAQCSMYQGAVDCHGPISLSRYR